MASIHKDSQGRSPYWYCAYYGADGRRMQRSTRQTDRKAALEICALWEKASEKARRHELTAAAGRKVIAEMVSISSGEVLEFHSVEEWMRSWLDGGKGAIAATTFSKYEQTLRDFLTYLGKRAKAPLASVSPADIVRFRDHQRGEGRSVETVNLIKVVLNIPFDAARRQGVINFNPVSAVDNLRTSSAGGLGGREAFTLTELSQLVAGAEGDWKGAIILGATSGLRLGDVAALRWESVVNLGRNPKTGLSCGDLRLRTQKTGAVMDLPMHSDFAEWLTARPERGIGKAYVFPSLSHSRTGGVQGLSRQFRAIMDRAGIVERIVAADGRKGRARSNKGFHALRHTFVSGLANSGVVSELRQRLVGHSDSGVHRKYTHHEFEVLRDAVAKIPSLNRRGA